MSTRGRRPAWLALGLAGSLVLGACNPAPPASPSPAAPAGTSLPASSDGAATSLADALRDAVDVDAIVADLGRLQAIADAHGGNRAAGTEGYDASAAFVADELRRAGLVVDMQPVTIPAFAQTAPSTLAIDAPGGARLRGPARLQGDAVLGERRRHGKRLRARLRPERAARRPRPGEAATPRIGPSFLPA